MYERDTGLTSTFRGPTHTARLPHAHAHAHASPQHHLSTPHLDLYRAVSDQSCVQKEAIYSSAVDVRKLDERKSSAVNRTEALKRITCHYDSVPLGTSLNKPMDDPLAVTDEDVLRLETFFRGHRTQVWSCRTLANLYHEEGAATGAPKWRLKVTGVPLLLLDHGDTKSRQTRLLQIIVAEKGTGFPLWSDQIDNLTSYRAQEDHFHTFYLSSDHRRRVGLSFNDPRAARDFYAWLERLVSDPHNIRLSSPGKKKIPKPKPVKYRPPRKTEISLPCNFQHVTNVGACDKTKFFSLKRFSTRSKAIPAATATTSDMEGSSAESV